MPGQIHKDINAVFPDFFRHLIRAFSCGVIPVISKLFDPFCHSVGFRHFGVAEYLHLGFIMPSEQGVYEVGTGMAAKIRRHITHAKLSVRGSVSCIFHNLLIQRLRVFFIPLAMLLIQPVSPMLRAVMQCKEIVAVRLMIIGPVRHC